jgi:hypothetical protein
MSTILLVALGTALALLTATEARVVGNYRSGVATAYAAEAAIEAAADEVLAAPDWNAVLGGEARSSLVDGAPSGGRATVAGTIDLIAETNMVRCGKAAACSDAEIAAATSERPRGANNPVWQLYAYGPLRNLLRIDASAGDAYVIVWAGDDPSDCDARPDQDGAVCAAGANPGAGVMSLLAHAYGAGGTQRAIEITVARSQPPNGPRRVGILSWQEVR